MEYFRGVVIPRKELDKILKEELNKILKKEPNKTYINISRS